MFRVFFQSRQQLRFAHLFFSSNIGNIKVDKNSTFSDELVEAEEVEVDLEVVEEVRYNHTQTFGWCWWWCASAFGDSLWW